MSFWLSQSSLMAPVPPAWLETICQRLTDNDPTLDTVDLANMQRIDDVFSKIFARALEHNTTCTTLIISFASLVDDGAFAIASVMAKNKYIRKLQLRDLRNHREVAITLDNMNTNTTVMELSFRHCQICSRSAQAIQRYLQANPNIQEVRLVDCQLLDDNLAVDASMEHLSQGFQQSKSLRRIYMLNMDLEPAAATHIAAAIAQSDCCLEELYLAENNLADEGARILAEAILASNKTLCLLDMRSNSITDQGALSFQGLVARSQKLQSLCLGNNELGPSGTAALARGLQQSRSRLIRLQLNDNDVGRDGCKSIANMLRINKTMQELDLSMNGICNEGAAALAKALTKNKTLRSMNLRRNNISDQGALEFASRFVGMQGLKELIMNKNDITAIGGTALLQALQYNTEIEYLTVTEDASADRKMVHWFRLNRAGRRIFKHHDVPSALWSKVFGNIADTDSLYFFVKARPEVVPTTAI